MAKHFNVDAAVESLFALPSDSDSNSVSEECSSPSSDSAQREVCGYREGDDDGASAQTALAIRTLCALCRAVTATILLGIEIVRFPYQMITLKRMKLLLMSRTRTGK